jgi:NADH-quinone oxidoreductase subunit D
VSAPRLGGFDVEREGEQIILNMGPQHPSTHGVLRLVLALEGEVIADVKPDIGYLHRATEWIGEHRTYTKFLPYTDRTDYVASLAQNFGYVEAVERLAGIEVPRRAKYIRVILAELTRLASHLLWLGTFGLDLGAMTIFLYGMREREYILDLFEMAFGARLTHHGFRIGGVPYDLPLGFREKALEFCDYLLPRLDENDALLTGNRIFVARTQGVGILTTDQAIAYAASGPVIRGSGVAMDVRRVDPYAAYDEMEFAVAVQNGCDVLARYLVRIEEMRQSVRIIRQALKGLPRGDFQVKLPKIFRPPAGDAYGRVETPRGDLSVYVVSDGRDNPVRVRMRSPCFANLQALPVMARGGKVADIVAIIASIDIVLGSVDR